MCNSSPWSCDCNGFWCFPHLYPADTKRKLEHLHLSEHNQHLSRVFKIRGLTWISWHLNSPNFLFPQSQRKFLRQKNRNHKASCENTIKETLGIEFESIYCKRKNKIPLGINFKDVVSIVAFIDTGQTNPCRLCSTGSASVAGKHSLSLHITL